MLSQTALVKEVLPHVDLYACPGRSSNAGLVVGSGPLPLSKAGLVVGLTVSGFSGGGGTPSAIGGLVVVGQPIFLFLQHHSFFSGDQLSLVRQ